MRPIQLSAAAEAILSTTAQTFGILHAGSPLRESNRPAQCPTSLTTGEVREVDAKRGKLTISHGPILHLAMPALTMVFRAAKADLLKNLRAGDKIRFRAQAVARHLVVVEIRPAM